MLNKAAGGMLVMAHLINNYNENSHISKHMRSCHSLIRQIFSLKCF